MQPINGLELSNSPVLPHDSLGFRGRVSNYFVPTFAAWFCAVGVALLLAESAYAKTERDPAVMREFMKAHPCPEGPDKGSTKRCSGWQKDHIVPLECSGADHVLNLQWLTIDEHKRKTVSDNAQCRYGTLPNPLKPAQLSPPTSDR